MAFSAITVADIRDHLVKRQVAQDDVDAAHKHLVYMAASLGVLEDDMLAGAAVHYLVKEYAIEFATARRAQLLSGLSMEQLANGAQTDPMGAKWKAQRLLCQDLETKLTREIFTGDADTAGEFAIGGELYRG